MASQNTFNLKRAKEKAQTNLWKWIVPPAVAFSLLVVAKSYLLLEIIKERP
jgi:hypothetical protein